ncbi:MAG TPA: cupin domain-containing protein [Ilumatobacter sp.]
MDSTGFTDQLRHDGYDDVSVAGFAPGHALDEHAHPYALRGLVTDGEFVIAVGGDEQSYRVGDVFELDRDRPHTERVGPDGVTFVIGRRHPADTGS